MDGRDAMSMSGAASYYIAHRGIPGSQSGLHLTALPGGRSIPNLGTSLTAPPSGISVVAFQVESPPAVSSHSVVGLGEGVSQAEPVKRKRGRPRKYGLDGSVALALSPVSAFVASGPVIGSGSSSESGADTQKRGRGRPPGTGRKQLLASLGEWVAGSAGMGFTPHVITIAVGEDIATKIMSFSRQGPRAVCIFSANGVLSSVTLPQSATSGGMATYEGQFEILGLSGSYMMTDNGESWSRTGGLNISLSSPDGRVIGGGVAGVLKAATPVQVIVGSFIYTGSTKAKNKAKANIETNQPEVELQVGDEQTTPFAAPPSANLASPIIGGWPGSRQLDMRNAHIDIDLRRG